MRVFTETFERNRIVHFSFRIPGVVELHERKRINLYAGNRVLVIMKSNLESKITDDFIWKEEKRIYFNQGIMFTRSKTVPVPSSFLVQTGCSKG